MSIQAQELFIRPTSQKIKEKYSSVENFLPMWQRIPTSLLSSLPVTSMYKLLGTKFNLRAYENIETVEVALVEGSVLFKTSAHPNEILRKGEMIQYNRTSQKIVRDTFLANLYKCPAKSEGFYFSNLPLSDIVKELEYYFDTRIIILDQKLGDSNYIAYFTNGETLDEILSNLNTDGQMSITRSQGVIMITSATQ